RHDVRRRPDAEGAEDRDVVHLRQPGREVLPGSLPLRHRAHAERTRRVWDWRHPLLPRRTPGAPRGHRDVRGAVAPAAGHRGHGRAGEAALELHPWHQAAAGGVYTSLSVEPATFTR